MKIECEKEILETEIQKASRLANKHLTLPVLSCVHLSTNNNKLVIKSTNLDIGLEIDIDVETIKEGSVAIPANIFLNVLLSIKSKNIIIEKVENNIKITSKNSSYLIKCLPEDDFPLIPKIQTELSINIKISDFIYGLKSVLYSASNSSIKPELASVYIYKNNNSLFFVSTDSFRLAEKKINIKSDFDFPSIIIPIKNVNEIIKIFNEKDNNEINILFDKNQIVFKSENIYLVSRLIDGNFPDYKQIIPKSFSTNVTLLKEDIINTIKSSNIFSDSLNQLKFKINPKENKTEIEVKNNDIGEFNEIITTTIEGDILELSFNSRYIIDCMQSINSDSIVMGFAGQGKPLLIKGISDNTFVYIVMPMNK